MIFVYGVKGKVVLTEQVRNLTCKSCGQSNTMYINIVSRYFHLFWIPLFPVGKKAVMVCTHCKQTSTEKHMPAEYTGSLEEYRSKAKIPVWQFAGLILLALFTIVPLIAGAVAAVFRR